MVGYIRELWCDRQPFRREFYCRHLSGWRCSGVLQVFPWDRDNPNSVKPGSFNPPTGTSPEFGYSITGGKVWFTYGGKRFGYIPESYWRGGFGAVTETQTYGEVYDNSPGGSPIPTMNGRVSHYRTNTGSHLTRYTLSSPYRITHGSGTSFTFSS